MGSGATSVLANDVSNDGRPQDLKAAVVANASTAHGTLTLNADGSFRYAPDASFQGIDRFSYQASEGAVTGNTATVTLLSNHASLVDKLFHQVLHRSAEDAGLLFWTGLLDRGSPLDVVATGIFNSVERLNPLVTQFYQNFLGRGPDPDGLSFWVADWQQKGDPRDVVERILASPEFFDLGGGTNMGYIARLYERVLLRHAEQAGLDYWVGLMGPPMNETRLQIATQFYDTHEKHAVLVDFLFGEYFQGTAAPDPTPYVALLDNGETQTQVEQAIIDSPDYRNSPPTPAAGTVGRALYDH
jgi:VCBS repeat-containing protein